MRRFWGFKWKISGIMVVAGIVLSVLGYIFGADVNGLYYDRFALRRSKEKTEVLAREYDEIDNIDIEVVFADIEFVVSGAYKLEITGYLDEWQLEDSGQSIKISQKAKNRRMMFGFRGESEKVVVYLPDSCNLDNVVVKTGSGEIRIGGFNASLVDINNTFGDVVAFNINSGFLSVKLNSGDFSGSDISSPSFFYSSQFGDSHFADINAETFECVSNSGSISLERCEVLDITIRNTFGDTIANNLASGMAEIEARSGNVDIVGDMEGQTTITSMFGDVKISLAKPMDDYSYDINTDFGDIAIGSDRFGSNSKNQLHQAPARDQLASY
ncbi:MAG: DUF4097 domain-containing protein [Eubacteriaceae bacterium]|nr:DUF4097 domain-containing protein [Eubacteriaceae bacterium]